MFHSTATGTSPSTAMARAMRTLRWSLASLLLCALTPALAQANTLQSINSTPLPDNKLEVVLGFSGPPPKPLGFTIENPAKIALDFTGTKLGLSKRSYDIGVGAVSSITTAEAGGRARLVFNLTNSVPYKTRIDGNKVIVTLSTATAAQIANSGNNTAHFGNASATTAQNNSISNIEFHRGKDGGGLITLTLGDPNQAIDLTQRAGKIIVNAYNAQIAQNLQQRMVVSDFGTPVSSIDARQNGNNVQLVINASGDYEQLAYQADNKFTIDIKPQAQTTAGGAAAKPKYTGQRISLNFQNIAVRSVLQLLADFTGLNIVVSDAVTGNVTLRLKNVPWDQALAIILQSKGLAERRSGNVIMIAPAKDIAAQEQEQAQAQQAIQKLAPLHTEIFQIRYTKAAALASLLKSIQSSLSGNGGNAQQASSGVSGLSTRGSVVADDRTNSLIVRDTDQGLGNVAQLIQRLDVPVKQVLIGSRLVFAKKSFSRDLGVNFGVTAPGRQGGGQGGVTVGSSTYGIGGSPNGQLFNVNLPAAAPTSTFGLSLAKLNSTFNLSLEISAAEQEGTVRQISNPRVITANDKAAMIQQGVQIPYQEASSSGATSTSFKTAALKLQVTPHITPNNRILMELDVSNDSVGGIYNGVPSINTQEVKTQVMVDNGQTVVLGGIYQEDKEHTVNKVPFFGDLPVLGNLFRENVNTKTRNELLIFITPKIINNNLTLTQ